MKRLLLILATMVIGFSGFNIISKLITSQNLNPHYDQGFITGNLILFVISLSLIIIQIKKMRNPDLLEYQDFSYRNQSTKLIKTPHLQVYSNLV